MPKLPEGKRPPLKIEPTDEEIGAQIARSLNQIAAGFAEIVETLDALTFTDINGDRRLRVDRP
jgi:hypothetical protein